MRGCQSNRESFENLGIDMMANATCRRLPLRMGMAHRTAMARLKRSSRKDLERASASTRLFRYPGETLYDARILLHMCPSV